MRRFGRRRKQRVVWFPPIGAQIQQTGVFVNGNTFQVPVISSGAIFNGFLPLTFDEGQEQKIGVANVSLSDLQNSAWRLRRLILNIFATFSVTGTGAGDPVANASLGAIFAVGAMVATVDETGAPVNTSISILDRDDNTDPWIFRRVWLLSQHSNLTREGAGLTVIAGSKISGGAVTDTAFAFTQFPRSTTEYGYVAGGPYVDQKTNRVIGPEQRLLLFFGSKQLPIQDTAADASANIVGYLDYRLLGNLQRSSNRRNASR